MIAGAGGSAVGLRSRITSAGELRLTLEEFLIPHLADEDVLIEVEASPINPSDLGLLTGAADLTTAVVVGTGGDRILCARVPPPLMPYMEGRLEQSMPVGNEGAGRVVQAGRSDRAVSLLGKLVAVAGGSMYARYQLAKAEACLVLPDGTTAAEGASCFVNPLTALGMVETMRGEGFAALVHTAAASNLGQMLNRICIADRVPLVNIVRRPEQAATLREQGAAHVCDSSSPHFPEDLKVSLKATGANLAFDAVGGGRLADDVLAAMEAVASECASYSRYGSAARKQIYIYGALDLRPTELTRSYGLSWGVGGWLLTQFLERIGSGLADRLRARVVAELTTTFRSHYVRTISLDKLLDPATLLEISRKTTGGKVLVDPRIGWTTS